MLKNNDQTQFDFPEESFSEDGYYYIRLRIISSDIEQKLNSIWSEFSKGYHYDSSNSSGTPGSPSTPPGPSTTPSGSTYYPSSSGGSQSYTITVQSPILHGAVKASRTSATKGTKVTITVTPDGGYQLETLAVKDVNGNTINVDIVDANSYEFVMPGSNVTVSATFKWINTFTDVFESDWFYDNVAYVVQNGLMDGMGNQQFNPYGTTTRGMVMTILARRFGIDTTPTGNEVWYQKGMEWAMREGVSDGTNPGGNITREQLATMLWRYAGEPAVSGSLISYPDAENINEWARNAMIWAVQNGIINGSDGKLEPQGNALRSQAAAMFTRFCQNIEK